MGLCGWLRYSRVLAESCQLGKREFGTDRWLGCRLRAGGRLRSKRAGGRLRRKRAGGRLRRKVTGIRVKWGSLCVRVVRLRERRSASLGGSGGLMMPYRWRVRASGVRVCRVNVCGLRMSALGLSTEGLNARGIGIRTSGLSTRGVSAVRFRASGLSLWVRMDVGTQDLKSGESSRTQATGVVSPRAGMEDHVTVEVDAEGEGRGAGATTVQLSVRLFLGAAWLGITGTHAKPAAATLKQKTTMQLQDVKLEVLDVDECPTT